MSEIVALASYEEGANSLFLNSNFKEVLQGVRQGQKSARETILLVRSMLGLIACIQRHRGATMALLGGDDRFAERMPPLQKEIALRIDLLMLEPDEVIEAVDKQNVIGAWKTISHNWQDDAVLENFEYHSHLIEYLLRMLRGKGDIIVQHFNLFAELLNDPLAIKVISQLNALACTSIPDCFELLAKLRGLATHAAASHKCDSFTKGRMDFSLKELNRLTAKMDLLIHDLDEPLQKYLIPGNELAQAKVKRDYLTHLLSNDIIEGVSITVDSEMIYRVTTEIIDTYYAFSEKLLTHIENQLPTLVNRCLGVMG
ncbi:MAG: hypothetical protein MI867_28015 [Pseudomonadales bacterium]|nr:hypothetical protein [Pseudomonadales bacterium]